MLLDLKQFWATERPLKMMKNPFYFTLKALFILKVFTFLSWLVDQNLLYFTARVPDTSDTSVIRTTRVRHECYTNDTSATRVENLILITTRVKTYFHTPILAMHQMKDYKERNDFILRTTFWKWLVPMPKCVWKVHHKIWTLQLQKLYQKVIY